MTKAELQKIENDQEKMSQVRKILKELESIILDHIEDGGDMPATALIESALEIYKTYCEDEEDVG